jgi:hypothetical protein
MSEQERGDKDGADMPKHDTCSICGKPIEDGQRWIMTNADEIAHEVCFDLEAQ